MTLPRRKFLHFAAGAAALPAVARIARADTYPSHPVRLIAGFAAGSATDILARLMGQWLSQRLGQQFVIENRPGAGGNVGAEEVSKAAADGYTLLMVPPAVAANATLYPHLNFVFLRNCAPVAGVVRVPNVAEVNPSVPVKTIPELIAYAKADGQAQLKCAHRHAAAADDCFGAVTRTTCSACPVGRRPAMVGDRWPGPGRVRDHDGVDRTYPLRPVACACGDHAQAFGRAAGRSDRGGERSGLRSELVVRHRRAKGTPADIVETLNRETNAGLADQTIKARLDDMGGMALTGSPADFGKLIADETEKWGKVIRDAGIKAE